MVYMVNDFEEFFKIESKYGQAQEINGSTTYGGSSARGYKLKEK